jgi:hypothetical protein
MLGVTVRSNSGAAVSPSVPFASPEYPFAGPAMESISSVLFSLYRDTPFREEWLLACLAGAWHGLLGGRIANVSRPQALCRDELVVVVTDAAWLPVLSDMQAEFLRRIQGVTAGEVRRLKLVSPGSENPAL